MVVSAGTTSDCCRANPKAIADRTTSVTRSLAWGFVVESVPTTDSESAKRSSIVGSPGPVVTAAGYRSYHRRDVGLAEPRIH